MRIAISGTYSTGKTTTALALSHITGYDLTTASTMRELLPIMLPGRKLEECNAADVLQLVLTRVIERCCSESGSEFIADGCPFQEYSYSIARLKYGINPNQSGIRLLYDRVINYKSYLVFESIIKNIEDVLVEYVNGNYDYIVHLPLEIPLDLDGHRPVNEDFRCLSETVLKKMYTRINIPVIEVSGSISNRVEMILDSLNIVSEYDIDKVIENAKSDCYQKYNSIVLENQIIQEKIG